MLRAVAKDKPGYLLGHQVSVLKGNTASFSIEYLACMMVTLSKDYICIISQARLSNSSDACASSCGHLFLARNALFLLYTQSTSCNISSLKLVSNKVAA